MTDKEFTELFSATARNMAHEQGQKLPFRPVASVVAFFEFRPRLRKACFHASVICPVALAAFLLDKAPAFASAELGVTLIAHSYSIVGNFKGKGE